MEPENDIPQGLKPGLSLARHAKAKALAYLEATAEAKVKALEG